MCDYILLKVRSAIVPYYLVEVYRSLMMPQVSGWSSQVKSVPQAKSSLSLKLSQVYLKLSQVSLKLSQVCPSSLNIVTILLIFCMY